uniref:Uncharacterized protein n=1 Tax=Trichuris muris TaxID=70415 RepID=A0A5S6QF46_TRIMR
MQIELAIFNKLLTAPSAFLRKGADEAEAARPSGRPRLLDAVQSYLVDCCAADLSIVAPSNGAGRWQLNQTCSGAALRLQSSKGSSDWRNEERTENVQKLSSRFDRHLEGLMAPLERSCRLEVSLAKRLSPVQLAGIELAGLFAKRKTSRRRHHAPSFNCLSRTDAVAMSFGAP